MSLSSDLVSQFVKATKDTSKSNTSTDIYGTIKKVGSSYYVMLDGSEVLTPITTVTDLVENDRVIVSIDNHTATVTGNVTAASNRSATDPNGYLRVDNLIAGRIDTNLLVAASSEFGEVKAKYAEIQDLDVESLNADLANIDTLNAKTAFITNVSAGSIQADFSQFDQASARSLLAAAAIIDNATIDGAVVTELVGVTIDGDLIQAGTLVADKILIRTSNGLLYKLNAEALGASGLAEIEDLQSLQNGLHGAIINDKTIVAEKISVSDLVAFDATIAGFHINKNSVNYTYVRFSYNSDGSDMVTMPYIDATKTLYIGVCDTTNSTAPTDPLEYTWVVYADNVDGDGYNTKRVEGVECQNGYLHFAFAITSDGSDHFYRIYKRWGSSVNDRQYVGMYIDDEYHDSADYTDYEWTYITDSTEIKAECPDGLPGRLYSGSKGSISANATRGIYLDDTGQMNIGDANSYIKFYNDNGTFKLDIAADDVKFGSSKKTIAEALSDISESAISSVDVEYYNSTSPTSLAGGSWSSSAPTWTAGRYIWSRTKITDANSTVSYTNAVCITGNTGATGATGAAGAAGANGQSATSLSLEPSSRVISVDQNGVTNPATISVVPKIENYPDGTWFKIKYLYDIDDNGTEELYQTLTSNPSATNYGAVSTNIPNGEFYISGGKFYCEITDNGGNIVNTEFTPTITITTANIGTEYYKMQILRASGSPAADSSLTIVKVFNGTDGADGADGSIGPQGPAGTNGTNGVDGQDGQDGADGISVTDVVEEYYLSTSEIEPTGGSWELEQPEWSEGRYIWTRSAITWSTDTTTHTEPILAQALTDANKMAKDAKSAASTASTAANSAKETADNAYSEWSKTNESIKSLVVGKNGSSLMKQTADGWQFNFGDFERTLDDIADKTEYVNVTTSNGDPCIELGDTQNEMQLQLTNKAANFKVGAAIPTKVTNEGIETDDVTINDELRHGNFVWKQRTNGNYCLSKWKDD